MNTPRSDLIKPLPLGIPEALPIAAQADAIVTALQCSQVVVVAGETGSGKTTQLPKLCLRAGLGTKGLIGHTQPRRLAARAVANRLAEELEVSLGAQVGYSVRFADRTSAQTLIKLMTDGLLLAEIQGDRDLSRYEVLIIDEAHERSLNIDFLLGYLKGLLRRRPEFKLVITSATIDTQAFAEHFDAPVIEVSGRGYPVAVEYLAPADNADSALVDQVLECVRRMEQSGNGGAGRDALVFLSGEREIFSLARELKPRLSQRWELLPLYARLPTKEQQRVFSSGTLRRLVLCTNVAETSLTVPNIGYVIDVGLARISRYSYRSKLQRLPIEAISQASANQRMGRCGRVAPGTCFRLYDQADFEGRPDYTDPEIKRTNLASVVLQMEAFRLGDIHRFPFLEPPENGAVRAAIKLLEELQAFESGRATALGRQMARLPVDPRLARMILEGAKRGALAEILVIVSGLSVQDPRERPPGQRGQADARHEGFAHERSDFLSWLNLWQWSEKERETLTRRRFERLLKTRFLSVPRMREWREVHRQLRLACQGLRLKSNQMAAEYGAVHQALLSGSLGFVGRHDERGVFEGVQNLKFRIFPGSALFEQRPKWMMASEIAETQKVYARCVAHIEPGWIEEQADHLLKRQYSEPHFSAKRGEAMAYEKVSFRGLPLVERRRVSYTAIDPELARGLLISEGLVIGALAKKPPFLDANLARVRDLQQQEAKMRRRDLLIAAEEQAAWYHERLPATVVCQRSLQGWLKRRPENDSSLRWTTDDLSQSTAVGLADYPSELQIGDLQFRLRYRFAPGDEDDGVSIEVPLGKLSTLSVEDLSWGVPGTFEAQCEAWLKTLPKARRRALAPLADRIAPVAQWLLEPSRYRAGQLRLALANAVSVLFDVALQPAEFVPERIDPHLLMNVRVLGSNGKVLENSRDLAALQHRHQQQLALEIAQGQAPDFARDHVSEYPATVSLLQQITEPARGKIPERVVYPGFVDQVETVALQAFATAAEAANANRVGLARLALLAMSPAVRKVRNLIREQRELQLHYATLGSREQLEQDLLLGSAWHCYFHGQPWPTNRAAFDALLAAGEPLQRFVAARLPDVCAAFEGRFRAGRLAHGMTSPAFAASRVDALAQLEVLAPAGLLRRASPDWLAALPRYFEALCFRIEHLQGRVDRDQQHMAEIASFEARLERLRAVPGYTDTDAQEGFGALQELRVALFADPLRKPRVSSKRLDRQYRAWEVQHALV